MPKTGGPQFEIKNAKGTSEVIVALSVSDFTNIISIFQFIKHNLKQFFNKYYNKISPCRTRY